MSVEEASSLTVEEQDDAGLPKACPLCKKGFDKIVPKLLPCLHSFCQPCLEVQLNEQQEQPAKTPNESTTNQGPSSSRLKCPKCGQEFLVPSRGIASLIDNQFILEIVSKPSGEDDAELHVCTSCDDQSSSTSYCLNCTEWLCDACIQAHQRVRVTKDHEIKSRQELKVSLRNHGRTERALYCDKHPSEKLKLFCANCERLTCRDCQLLEHKDHKYQFVNEAAIRYRDYFKKRLAALGEKIGPLAESIESVENASKHLDHKAEVVANEIKTSSLDIVKAVKQRENVLLTELKALVHFKRKMLTKQSKDLNLMQEILSHNYGFAKHAIDMGSDVSLLHSKRQLGSRIQNLLSLKYRVTPVAHGDLKFATESVRLCNAILKAGSVMTPTQHSSVSSGTTMAHRNPTTVPQHQNGGSNLKVNPLNTLNAYNNQQIAGILSGNPTVRNAYHKPSSKVYPNVVSSQMSMSGSMGNSMHFLNSNSLLNPQMRVVAKPLNPGALPHSAGASTPFYPNPAAAKGPITPRMRMPVQANGSGIPLHHMDSGKRSVTKSPPSYDKTLASMMKSSSTSSSPGLLESTSQTPSPQGNVFTKTSRDLRREGPGSEPPPLVPSPKSSLPSPKPPQLSPSPLSPSLPKLSPNPSQNSLSPSQAASPKPQASPRPPQSTSSPLPSPLPTFVTLATQDSGAGVKVKVEKDLAPPELSCSELEEPERLLKSYTMFTKSYGGTPTSSPPSNNSSNDDWCAVCHNGGELLCCDTCPKVFHLQCHVPSLTTTPRDNWSCGLCQSFDTPQNSSETLTGAHKRRAAIGGMSERDTKVCEKILLELFCHSDSMPFQNKVSKAVPNYYKIIQKPMDLTSIKTKLQPVHFEHYNNINEFIGDCKLIFSNCILFNGVVSTLGKIGKKMTVDFQTILRKYLPQREENNDEPRAKRKKDEVM